MKNNGFLWTFEFLFGFIIILGLLIAAAQPVHEKKSQLPSILCHDLLTIWTYGENSENSAAALLPEKKYSFSNTPFPESLQNGITCHATRIKNGLMEDRFLRIEW